MTKLQAFYERTAKLEEFVILAYAVAVFLPITYSWVVLITGIVVMVLRAVLECLLRRTNGAECETPSETAGTAAADGNSVALCKTPTLKSITNAPFAIPLLIFSISVFISGLLNGGVKEAFASFFTLRAFLIYFVSYHAFRTSAGLLGKTVLVLLSFGSIAGIWGSIQQIFHYHPFDYPYLQASGFMGSPMAFAGQMEVTACLSFALLLDGGYKHVFKNRWIFYVIVTCNLAGVFFASERSAWLGMLFAVLIVPRMISFKMFLRVFFALILAGAIAWFTVPVLKTRIAPMFTNPRADVGMQARFVIWEKSFEVFKAHPAVGVGARKFPNIDIPEAIVPGESTFLVHAHCNILHIMATMGIVGLLSFLYLELSTIIVAVRNWRARDGDSLQRAVSLGVLGGVVSLMVAGLFEYNFGTGHVRLMHWFVLAMLTAKMPESKPEAEAKNALSKN